MLREAAVDGFGFNSLWIWNIFEDKHLFYGNDPDGSGYKTRAHLAEIVGLLGQSPLHLPTRWSRSKSLPVKMVRIILFLTLSLLLVEFLGGWIADIPVPENSVERSGENLKGKLKEDFVPFMKIMLQWNPEDRKTAAQLVDDPWLKDVL
jgi:serine/threonine-protein kinase SRPK3